MVKLAVICPVAKGVTNEIEFDFPEDEYARVQTAADAGEKTKIICGWLHHEGLRCADPDCDVPLENHYFSFRG